MLGVSFIPVFVAERRNWAVVFGDGLVVGGGRIRVRVSNSLMPVCCRKPGSDRQSNEDLSPI